MVDILKKIDWKIMICMMVLIGAGSLSLLSSHPDFFNKQILWIIIGLLFLVGIIILDLRSFLASKAVIYGIYYLINGLLIFTYFFAPLVKGNRAWLIIGPFQFQPSELAKIGLVIFLAYYFSKKHIGINKWSTLISSFIYTAIPAILIAIEPDLGNAMVLILVWSGFIMVSGLPLKRLALGFVLCAIVGVMMWTSVLKDYQKERILGMFNPEKDPLGVNYNVIQSKIAIGSGGLMGKGFGQGTQVQLGFLPESQNDFIFSAIAEEGGLFAISLVLFFFAWMLIRLVSMGNMVDLSFYSFLILGAVILFLIQFIFNVGSNLGLLPVVGVTLPFVSYGGSSILANMILVGIIQSVVSRK